MSEKKDYEYPYFKRYMGIVNEIEKIPASEQETKVVTMFHEFYKDMRDSLEVASNIINQWISVDDRLPEIYEMVSAISDGKTISSRYFDRFWYWSDISDEWEELKNVTHWQPLPTPLKCKQED